MSIIDKIIIKGARTNNLKNIDIEIPRNRFTVITGPSGSGKSSLAFDTIYAEGQRRYAESFSAYARQFLGMSDKPDVDEIQGLSPTISIDQKKTIRNPRSTVGTMTEIYDYIRLLFARIGEPHCVNCSKKIIKKISYLPGSSEKSKEKRIETLICPKCKTKFPKLEPSLFSFNSPYGACGRCKGLGIELKFDANLLIPNKKLSLAEGAIQPWTKFFSNQSIYWKKLEEMAKKLRLSLNAPVEKLKKEKLEIILCGEQDNDKNGFEGVIEILRQKYEKISSDFLRTEIEKYMRAFPCSVCKGKKLRAEALNVKISKKTISDITEMPIENSLKWLEGLELKTAKQKISQPIIKETGKRIKSLISVGLPYLALNRNAASLSGGEEQRIKIACQINSLLTGVTYVLDEPSIGLHPRDIDKLVKTLKQLRDFQNTVIVVEHDENIIRSADHIIDVGPGAGIYGGEIIAEGTLKEILKNRKSLTSKYLRNKNEFKKLNSGSTKSKATEKFIEIIGAQEHNLKNISVKFPTGKLACVTGVSGSGKSTLVIDILAKALTKKFYRAKALPGKHKEIKGVENINKIIMADQSPIGRTPRSNPVTYTGIFNYIRNLFANLPESKAKKYNPGFFSFNVDGGRCQYCGGDGYKKIEMQFLTDIYIKCEACGGKRYTDKILDIYYKGKNIADILDMSVMEATKFFKNIPIIYEKLEILNQVGLDYLPLGQSATTLSGGEAQRIKLASELSKRSTGNSLYILDEPTTGLHFDDINKLLIVLKKLVEKGNTVLIIEHNLEVIKQADWIIDLGPEGGTKGGELVAQGDIKTITQCKKSWTGKYLR